MAKKKKMTKKKSFDNSVNSFILAVYGLALFGLAFIPAQLTVLKNLILNETSTTATSFYDILIGVFENGFLTGTDLAMQIAVLVYFVVAVLAVTFGLLGFVKLVKNKYLALLIYFLGFAATLAIMILVLINNSNNAVNYPDISKYFITTWVYVQLALSTIGLGYTAVKLAKK